MNKQDSKFETFPQNRFHSAKMDTYHCSFVYALFNYYLSIGIDGTLG